MEKLVIARGGGRPQTGKKFTAKVAVSQFLSHVGIGKHPFFINIFQKLLQ